MTPEEYLKKQTLSTEQDTVAQSSFLVSQPQAAKPDEYAADRAMGKAFALPAEMVTHNRQTFAQRTLEARNKLLLSGAPKLSQWVGQADNFKLAADDIENLSIWERLGMETKEVGKGMIPGAIKAAGAATVMTGIELAPIDPTRRAPLVSEISTAGKKTPEEIAALRAKIFENKEINPTIAQSVLSDVLDGSMTPEDAMAALEPALAEVLGPASEALKSAGRATIEAGDKAVPAAAGMEDSFGRTAGEGLGYVLSLLGVTALSPMAGATIAVQSAGGTEAEAARAKGADEKTQAQAGAANLPVGLLDMIPLERLLNNPATRNGFMAFMRQVGMQAGVEGGQEATQQVLQNWIAQSLYDPERGSLDGVAQSFATGGFIGALMEAGKQALGAVVPGRIRKMESAAKGADVNKTTADEIGKAAASSKTKARAPDVFEQSVANSLDGRSAENVYVPADKMIELFQGVDSFKDFASDLGVTGQEIDIALESGGQIRIPTSQYAAYIAGTEIDGAFRENMTFSPEMMSEAEAADFNARKDDILNEAYQAFEEARQVDDANQAAEDLVYQEVVSRLRTAGRALDVATAEAQLTTSIYRTLAEREGVTLDEMVRRYPLPEIRGAVPQALTGRGNDALSLTLAEARATKVTVPKRGATLTEFISEYGGIEGQDAELSARNATAIKRKGKSTLKLAREAAGRMFGAADGKKYGLSDVALAAIEAGYLRNDPVANEFRHAMETGGPVPDIGRALMDRIDAELRGDPDYAVDAPTQSGMTADDVAQMEEYLSSLGVSLTADDAAIREAIDRDQAGRRSYAQTNRGSILFPATGIRDGQTVLNLFKNADLSTFNHEMGHYWLEVMRDMAGSSPRAAAEMATVNQWYKDNAGDVAKDARKAGGDVSADDVIAYIDNGTTGDDAKDAAIDVGMQEQWARAFEAYLMEGKSPSVELRSVFERMSAWLLRLYRNLTALNVKPSPELKQVFDRLVATDAQITAANEDMGDGGPVFTTAESMGMTEEQYERFTKLVANGQTEGKARLLKSVMKPIIDRETAEYKAARATVEDEVTKEFQSNLTYRAIQEMRFGKDFDGNETASYKLNRGIIEEQYGAGYISKMPGATADGKGHRNAVFAADGLHPDVLAEMLMFPSGRELLDTFANIQPIDTAIKTETERRMFERFNDPLRDGSIEEEALEAMHNDARAAGLAAELKALTEIAEIDRGLSVKQAREAARQTLRTMKVKDATASHQFLSAERRAGNEAYSLGRQVTRSEMWADMARRRVGVMARAVVKDGAAVSPAPIAGKIDAANTKAGAANDQIAKLIEAKRRQLINHMLFDESKKITKEVDKIQRKVAKLAAPDKNLTKKTDIDYANATRAIAAKFGLIGPKNPTPEQTARAAQEFRAWMEQLRFEDPIAADAMSHAIAVNSQDAKPFKDMTVLEFVALGDAIDNIVETGRNSKTIEIEGKKIDKAAAVAEMMVNLEGRADGNEGAVMEKLGFAKGGRFAPASWKAALTRAENLARYYDDGQQGAFTRYIIRPVYEALERYRPDKTVRLKTLLAAIEPRKKEMAGKKIMADELSTGFSFANKGEFIHAVLHSGNESNLEKLLIGRGWAPVELVGQVQRTTSKGKLSFDRKGNPIMTRGRVDTTAWDAFFQRMIDEGTFTADDVKMVNEIWALMESCLCRSADRYPEKICSPDFTSGGASWIIAARFVANDASRLSIAISLLSVCCMRKDFTFSFPASASVLPAIVGTDCDDTSRGLSASGAALRTSPIKSPGWSETLSPVVAPSIWRGP